MINMKSHAMYLQILLRVELVFEEEGSSFLIGRIPYICQMLVYTWKKNKLQAINVSFHQPESLFVNAEHWPVQLPVSILIHCLSL